MFCFIQNHQPTTWSLTNDRTRNWVLQQKIEGETKESNYLEMNGGETGYNHEIEMLRQKLQLVASKLHHLAQKASNRLDFSVLSSEMAFLDRLGRLCPL